MMGVLHIFENKLGDCDNKCLDFGVRLQILRLHLQILDTFNSWLSGTKTNFGIMSQKIWGYYKKIVNLGCNKSLDCDRLQTNIENVSGFIKILGKSWGLLHQILWFEALE